MGALKPTVSGIGFYLHKELGAAEVGILSTQRISCGRDLDFIYATNSARPGSDFIYTHDFIYTPLDFFGASTIIDADNLDSKRVRQYSFGKTYLIL